MELRHGGGSALFRAVCSRFGSGPRGRIFAPGSRSGDVRAPCGDVGVSDASKFRQAAELINRTPAEKFPLVLQRIARRLGDVSDEAVFEPEEQAQLCEMFGMSNAELDGVLSASARTRARGLHHDAAAGVEGASSGRHGRRPRRARAAVVGRGATDYVTKLRDRTMVRALTFVTRALSRARAKAHTRLARRPAPPLAGRPEPRQLPVAAAPDDGRGSALPKRRTRALSSSLGSRARRAGGAAAGEERRWPGCHFDRHATTLDLERSQEQTGRERRA